MGDFSLGERRNHSVSGRGGGGGGGGGGGAPVFLPPSVLKSKITSLLIFRYPVPLLKHCR